MEGPTMFNPYNDAPSSITCQAALQNATLWSKFYHMETEMIITKSGRRMFPSLVVQLTDLDPHRMYCIFLEMIPASHCRFKYSTASGWAPAGSEEVQSPHRLYVHPEGPAKGEYWMSQPVNFSRVKLTNTPTPPLGQIVLSSMHKYQPRVIVAQTADPRTLAWSPSACFVFPETQFIAVTAYQNEKITQLKIDNNPFAKGFRQNGQAKCKRKRQNEEREATASLEEELICVTDEDEVWQNSVNADTKENKTVERDSPDSPTIKQARIEKLDDLKEQPASLNNIQVLSHTQCYNYPPWNPQYGYHPYLHVPYYNPYSALYPYPYPGLDYKTINHHHQFLSTPPKRCSDFSIKALLGY